MDNQGLCVKIEDLVADYMTREKAQKILIAWQEKPKSDWVAKYCSTEIQLDGNFTADELRAFAWCMENKIEIGDLL